MAAQVDENIQYEGEDGLPLVGGQIFIGASGFEPIGNLITIFSDPGLSVILANPQTIGAEGRSANKIYIPGKYSIRVNDVLGDQHLLDQTAGETADTGTTSLSNVQGTNAITADTATGITEYIDKEVYTLTIANTNDGSPVTLDIDGVGPLNIVKNFDQAIDAGDFTENQVIRVVHNGIQTNFAWVDASVKTKRITKGTDIASATSITVPDNDGNLFDLTGITTIGTINGIAGTIYSFITTGKITFTNGAPITIPGAADYTAVIGTKVSVFMLTDATCRFIDVFPPIPQIVSNITGAVNDGAVQFNNDDNIPTITQGNEFLTRTITPRGIGTKIRVTVVLNLTHSVTGAIIGACLYEGTTTNALGGMTHLQSQGNAPVCIMWEHEFITTSLSLLTFRVRAGGVGSAGTTTINGSATVRRWGGIMASSIICEEMTHVG